MGTVRPIVSAQWCLGPWLGMFDDWGWPDSWGPQSPGIIFTHVSGGCAVSLLNSSWGLSMWPLSVAWASSVWWCQGGWTSLLFRAPKVGVPKELYGSCMIFFWFIFRSHTVSLLLHFNGFKRVTKDGPDSIEEGHRSPPLVERSQRICGLVWKTVTQLALWPHAKYSGQYVSFHYIRLARKFVRVFLLHLMEKPEQTFRPIQ